MDDPTSWKALYEARSERLRNLARNLEDDGARLILLWAAYDYDLLAKGGEPDESQWRPH